jgi:hypothetical protein
VYVRKLSAIFLCAAALIGCSADPYKGRAPAPPDRLRSLPSLAAATPAGDAPHSGLAGPVPIGDGSESVAPNGSGNIPRVSARE